MMRWLLRGLVALVLVTTASAQRGGSSGPRGQENDGFNLPGVGQFSENKLDRIGNMLHLNREQKNSVKEIFDAAQKEADPLREEVQKSRAAIATAILAEKGQDEVDRLLAANGNLMAQMTGIELKAFAKVVAKLTADQQKRVGPVFAFMSGMFGNRNWNTAGN
jgi:Spy/CpxP family protein refolding chaperone